MAINATDAQRKGASLNPGVRNNFLCHLHGELKEELARSKAYVSW